MDAPCSGYHAEKTVQATYVSKPFVAGPRPFMQRAAERGVALVVVLVLSGIMLAIMTALVYMITVGTQMSGSQKQYKTALQAGLAASDILYQIIGYRGNTLSMDDLFDKLDAQGMTVTQTITSSCTGTGTGSGLTYKIQNSTGLWDDGTYCNQSLIIDPSLASSYDLRMKMGSYTVFAKFVDTVAGNTGDDYNLSNQGVVSSGELPVVPIPSQYTIEVDAENTSLATPERAKLSILYQY